MVRSRLDSTPLAATTMMLRMFFAVFSLSPAVGALKWPSHQRDRNTSEQWRGGTSNADLFQYPLEVIKQEIEKRQLKGKGKLTTKPTEKPTKKPTPCPDPTPCASVGDKAVICGAAPKCGRAKTCCDDLICGEDKRCAHEDTEDPTWQPSLSPVPPPVPSMKPVLTPIPSQFPSNEPSAITPHSLPTSKPSNAPSITAGPSIMVAPSQHPTSSALPSVYPSTSPSTPPSIFPTPTCRQCWQLYNASAELPICQSDDDISFKRRGISRTISAVTSIDYKYEFEADAEVHNSTTNDFVVCVQRVIVELIASEFFKDECKEAGSRNRKLRQTDQTDQAEVCNIAVEITNNKYTILGEEEKCQTKGLKNKNCTVVDASLVVLFNESETADQNQCRKVIASALQGQAKDNSHVEKMIPLLSLNLLNEPKKQYWLWILLVPAALLAAVYMSQKFCIDQWSS